MFSKSKIKKDYAVVICIGHNYYEFNAKEDSNGNLFLSSRNGTNIYMDEIKSDFTTDFGKIVSVWGEADNLGIRDLLWDRYLECRKLLREKDLIS